MVLMLTEEDVRQVLTMDMALSAVEEVLRHMALEEAHNIPRARTQADQAMLHLMAASDAKLGVMGYKVYATTRRGADFHLGLYDCKTGELLALMQADYLGQMRTGAASGHAIHGPARGQRSGSVRRGQAGADAACGGLCRAANPPRPGVQPQ